jgi:hypothetical protein
MAVDFVSVGLLQWRDLDSDDLSLGLGCCLFLRKKLCMASDQGSVKLKICHSQMVGKKWSVGKAFTDATYTDRPKKVGKSSFTNQLKV